MSLCRIIVIVCCLGTASSALAEELRGWVDHEHVLKLNPGISGRVISVSVAAGDRVLKGTRLITLESGREEAAVSAASAAVAAARADVDEVQRALDRDEQLYDEGSLSAVALDQRRISHLRAELRLKDAQSDLAAARRDLGLSYVDAPVDGRVLGVGLAAGEVFLVDQAGPTHLLMAGPGKVVRAMAEAGDSALPPLGGKVSVETGGARRDGVTQRLDSVSRPGQIGVTVVVEGELPAVGSAAVIRFGAAGSE